VKKRPILDGNVPNKRDIKTGTVPPQKKTPVLSGKEFSTKFTFSLQYFKQIKYFEIGNLKDSWYVSLIERLQQLSQKDWQAFEKDIVEKRKHRYHVINWESKNVPIKRSDLNWLDKDYLNNEEDFPIIQFQISMALGRVVGFWDVYHVFQIILLDPMHNIQPAQLYSYKVDDTYLISCEYSSLIIDLVKLQDNIQSNCTCKTCAQLKTLPSKLNQTNLLIAHLDDESKNKVESMGLTMQQIIEVGLATFDN
jgi:hypothetical protein